MSEHDVSRRDFLKRGAALGGAVVWATPMVQMVGMRPALAQVASPACLVWYAVKIDPTENPTPPHCVDIHDQESPNLRGQCLDVDEIGTPTSPQEGGCNHIVSSTTPSDGPWTVTLDSGCQFVAASDRCFVKSGAQAGFCIEGQCSWDFETRTLTFPQPTANSISHIEFAFCCED